MGLSNVLLCIELKQERPMLNHFTALKIVSLLELQTQSILEMCKEQNLFRNCQTYSDR